MASFIELGRPIEREMLIDTFLWFYVDKCVFRRWLRPWSATLRMEQMMRVCVCVDVNFTIAHWHSTCTHKQSLSYRLQPHPPLPENEIVNHEIHQLL
jgi:hypothetical protein